ncbi:MAG: hypothetical protein ACKO37_02575, partial [Vampirovibrionales bacterium]
MSNTTFPLLPTAHHHTLWGVLGASKTGLSATQWLLKTQPYAKVWVSQSSPWTTQQREALDTLAQAYPDRLRYEAPEHTQAFCQSIQAYV